MKIINLLNRVIGNHGRRLKKADEYMYWSPFTSHHKPKLQINVKTGKWHCWVSNQGGHNLFQLLKKVGASRREFQSLSKILGETTFYKSSKDSAVNLDIKLPDEFKSLAEPHNSIIRDHAMLFLKKKGITQQDIKRYNLGYCSEGQYQNRIIIPSYDEHGSLNYFVGRDFYASTLKYKNPPIPKDVIGFDLYVNWSLPIVLVEGVFDAMSIKGNAIPLFGKSILPNLEKKITEKRVNSIFIVLDGDAFNDAIQMVEKFTDNGISVNFVKLDGKDPNDLGYRQMIKKIHEAVPMNFKTLMEMKIYGKQYLAN